MAQLFRPLLGSDLFADSFGYLNDTDLTLLTESAGAAAPANPVAYQVWLDTLTGLAKRRNAANDAWITEGVVGSDYQGLLPRSGGVMTGDLDMGTKKVLNLGLGTGTAAARVQEVDLKASLAAPQFTGDAQINQDPAGNNSLVRRSWTEGRYFKIAGGALTGNLTLLGNASSDLHAVPYQQLRDFVLFNTTAGHRHTGTDARKIRATDLDSGAATSGQAYTANGSGGGSFATISAPAVMLDTADPELFDAQANVSTTVVDLAASVPTGTTVAVLRLDFLGHVGRYMTVTLRPNGASGSTTYQFKPEVDNARIQIQAMVGLDATRKFQYAVVRNGGGGSPIPQVTAHLAGHIKTVV